MLRTRILAAATAALLMLGMSVGGAGAAMATPPTDTGVKVFVCKYVGTPGDDERLQTGNNPISVSVNAIPNYQGVGSYFADAQGRSYVLALDERQGGGQQGEPDVSECPDPEGPPPPPEPTNVTARVTFICKVTTAGTVTNVPGTYAAGDYIFRIRHEAGPATDYTAGVGGSGLFSGNLTVGEVEYKTTQTAVAGVSVKTTPLPNTYNGTASTNETACGTPPPPPPAPTCVVVVWKMPGWANSTTPTWPQTYVSVHDTDCDTPISQDVIPLGNDCYQLDKYFEGETTTNLIAGGFLNGPNNPEEDLVPGGWGVAYRLAQGPNCDPPTLPAIGVVADSAAITCDLDGWFRFGPGLGVSAEDAALLDWTVGPAEYAGDTATGVQHAVSENVTITITVSLDESAEGDYALVDESGENVIPDPVTGDITYTFEFTEPTDCPTLEGSTAASQCEQDAPYLEWTIDLTDAGESISFPTNATLTLRSKTDPSKFYEFPAYELTGTGASTGSALWPGAAVDDDGNGTAWPGWAFVDGEWVIDDSNFGWVRGGDVELFIQVNPEIAIDVSYPNATPDCANPPVVVPEITVVDECVGTGREAVQTATFTVTSAPNLRYVYTVGDGPETDVVFPDGETEVTIAVAPLAVVTVTAIPDADFRLAEGTEPFTYTFIGAAFCPGTFPATEADAELVLPDCLGNPGSVTLTNEGGVIWTLNGEVVAGNSSYDITPGTLVELTAALEGPSDEFPGGWTWSDPEQQTEWSELFPVADDDCLPTLALTGAGAVTNWLGVAAVLMTLAGMGFVLRRHRVEV
ncbi:hypothetical protein [Microcella humidisoli]|uniref:LPXTG-motif cell wall anchor domain-containing protein n=1 Tax=Microcella humidisoli TaxID=2963406 RepID=A0ABY5FZJ5_9MICO|nr:hypothetical protein [Microcella humidisoli]UTT63544.1 hypothetical protein NNL39_05445 [Microcella humidisoli]